MDWLLAIKSLGVAFAAALLASFGGAGAALVSCASGARTRALLFSLAMSATLLPPFLVANAWLALFGEQGMSVTPAPTALSSHGATAVALASLFWGIPFLIVGAALRAVPASILEMDPHMRGSALLRHAIWPLARRECVFAFCVVFVLSLNQFSIPALFQVHVLSAEVWVRFNTHFDAWEAAKLGAPLVLMPLLLLTFCSRVTVSSLLIPGGGVNSTFWKQSLGAGVVAVAGLFAFVLAGLSPIMPLLHLGFSSQTWHQLLPAVAAGGGSLKASLWLAAAGSAAVMVLGYLLHNWRSMSPLWFVFLVPGVLFGVASIVLLNRPALNWLYPSLGLVLGLNVLRYLVFGWTIARMAAGSVPKAVADLVRMDGLKGFDGLSRGTAPFIMPALAVGFALIFALLLWEVDVLALIVPPGGETAALRVFNLLHYGHNGQVNALCLALLVLGLIPVAAGFLLRGPARRLGWVIPCAGLLALGCGCGQATPDERDLDNPLFEHVKAFGVRGAGAGQFNKPRGIALDRADNVYVVDMTGRVQKFSPDGAYVLAWQMPETDKGKPKGMSLDHEGNIVLVEPHYTRLNHFDATGKLVAQWGVNGTNQGKLGFPRGVAVTSKGDLWVSEYGPIDRIQRFTARGAAFKQSVGAVGDQPGQFNRAEGLGVDSADRVYVADSCNHRVQVFSADGQFLRAYGTPGSGSGQFSYPYDVRVDASGLQFVCEFGNSRVQVFDASDRSVDTIGGAGGAAGQMNNPWSIALDSKGNLYVADSGNHRVLKFTRRKGTFTQQSKPG